MLAVLEHSLNSVASMLQAFHSDGVPAAAVGEPEFWRRERSVPVQGFQNFGIPLQPPSQGLSFEHQFPAVLSLI